MNDAMEYHGVDFRFVMGGFFKESSEYCTPWADKNGRDPNNLDFWLCVFKTQFYTGCGGMAKQNGNTCFIGHQALFRDDKVGVFHELGHNLGCPHDGSFCPPEFEDFGRATGKLYKTLMGAGGACDTKNPPVEKIRLNLFSDSTKQICEEGLCQSLGNEQYDCAAKIKREFAKDMRDWQLRCDATDDPNYQY